MSNRYPELTMITGAGEMASRDSRTVVFCPPIAGVALAVRIAAPLRGKQELAAVEATLERNRRRVNPVESGMVCLFV